MNPLHSAEDVFPSYAIITVGEQQDRSPIFWSFLMSLKEKLDAAFEALTQAGFLARQNFMCCGNCAGTALANEAEELVDAGMTPKGAVFFHQQDAEVLDWFANDEDDYDPEADDEEYAYQRSYRPSGNAGARRMSRGTRRLMVRYSVLGTTKHGDIGLPTVEIGKLVCETFDRFGITYTWDGNPGSCIEVNVE
jgi:hypothetical protein